MGTAYKTPDTFRFVVVVTNEDETNFDFIEFTPEEFEKACTIPPFKIYFNIDLLTRSANKVNHRIGTVTLEPKTFARLNNAYKDCKSEK